MVWKPELAGSQKGSLQALVQRWLMSFLEVRLSHYHASLAAFWYWQRRRGFLHPC
jgi:hypothetical protein